RALRPVQPRERDARDAGRAPGADARARAPASAGGAAQAQAPHGAARHRSRLRFLMIAPALVFDIETIPDIAGLRALRGIDASLPDADVYAAEMGERKAAGRSDLLPLYLQRVIVISCVFRSAKGLLVQSFVDR